MFLVSQARHSVAQEIQKCEVMANFMRNATAVSVTLAPVINKKQLLFVLFSCDF